MQIFPGNPRGWAHSKVCGPEAALFRERRRTAGVRCVAVHTAYLINLATPDDAAFRRSIALFNDELEVAEAIGADFLVTHLGSPLARDSAFAERRVCDGLAAAAAAGLGAKTMILLENTSGSGTGFGSDISVIGGIMDRMAGLGLETGLCFDTCHGFAAGYPLCKKADGPALAKRLLSEAGPGRLKLIHLNDSKGALASRLDRHEHIGAGRIDPDALGAFLNHPAIKDLPLIMETPKDSPDDDPRNLAVVRAMLK